jgi:hypothetical protein
MSVNARWIFLLSLESHLIEQLLEFRQYPYDGRESSTTDTDYLQSLFLETPSPEAPKSRERTLTCTGTDW